MPRANEYSIVVRHGVFDGEEMFEARAREFPDLAEYAESAEEAYALAVDAISTTQVYLSEKGRSSPDVLCVPDQFSGRVTLRLPRSLHCALSDAAQDEGVSLNQHLVNVLSYFTGFAHFERAAEARWTPLAKEKKTVSAFRRVSTRDLQFQIPANDLPRAAGY